MKKKTNLKKIALIGMVGSALIPNSQADAAQNKAVKVAV